MHRWSEDGSCSEDRQLAACIAAPRAGAAFLDSGAWVAQKEGLREWMACWCSESEWVAWRSRGTAGRLASVVAHSAEVCSSTFCPDSLEPVEEGEGAKCDMQQEQTAGPCSWEWSQTQGTAAGNHLPLPPQYDHARIPAIDDVECVEGAPTHGAASLGLLPASLFTMPSTQSHSPSSMGTHAVFGSSPSRRPGTCIGYPLN